MENVVGIGSRIVLQDIQGRVEELELALPASAKELNLEHGQISIDSPVGQALLGHKAGEEITVKTPVGERHYRILEVKPVERASASAAGAHAARG